MEHCDGLGKWNVGRDCFNQTSFFCSFNSVACLAALQRHGECLALVNKRLNVENDNADLLIMRARLHQLFRNVRIIFISLLPMPNNVFIPFNCDL